MRLRPYTSTYYPATGSTTPPPPVQGPHCHTCRRPLGASPSDWYCSENCQTAALRAEADRPDEVLRTPSTALSALAWLHARGGDHA